MTPDSPSALRAPRARATRLIPHAVLNRSINAERRSRSYAPRVPDRHNPSRAQIEGTVALLWLAIVGIAFVAAMCGHPL